jgi:hypothetical protein
MPGNAPAVILLQALESGAAEIMNKPKSRKFKAIFLLFGHASVHIPRLAKRKSLPMICLR